ncbi:hypothetical protein [Pantanalinema sp. GBBB05]|uniref:hypothetical protein n=1 Tax=Pantanalinema sp. GBBB05 TaxID=2604139 RepID=UPI003D812AAE
MLGCVATAPRSPSSSSPKSEAPPAVTTPVSKARSTAKDVQQKALERSTLAPTAPTDAPPSPQP